MKRLLGALLGLGATAALIAIVLRRANETEGETQIAGGVHSSSEEPEVGQHVERIHEGRLLPVTGRDEERDVLGAEHTLSPDAAQQVRANQRFVRGGKATSPAREGMFGDPGEAGLSGSQGGRTGREDQNPVGGQG